MKISSKLLLGLWLSLTVLTNQGCIALVAGAAAGAGGYAYATGSLVKNVDYSNEEVHEAALKGLEDLDAFILTEELNSDDSKIRAEDIIGKTIRINITALTEQASKIKIKVGSFGDETRSLQILNAITNRL